MEVLIQEHKAHLPWLELVLILALLIIPGTITFLKPVDISIQMTEY